MTLEFRLSLNWISSKTSRRIFSCMNLEPDNNENSRTEHLTLNKSSMCSYINTTVKDIDYFWKSEIASSAYLLEKKTFTKKYNFPFTLAERLKELGNVTFMSLVFDHWSNHKITNYLGVSLVTYDEKEGKQLPFLIKMDRSPSGKKVDINNQLAKIFNTYAGLSTITVGMSTDNATNILKVPKQLANNDLLSSHFLDHVPCLFNSANTMNSTLFDMVAKSGFGDIDSERESEIFELAAMKYQLKSDGSRSGVIKQDIFTEFLLSNDTKNISAKNEAESSDLLTFLTGDVILKKNNQLVLDIKTSRSNQELYRTLCEKHKKSYMGEPLALKIYTKTRRLSALEVLTRLYELKPVLMELNKSVELGGFLEEDDFILIEDLTEILLPFQSVCEMLSNDACTVKSTLPLLVSYKNLTDKMFVDKIKSSNTKYRHFSCFIRFKQRMDSYYEMYINMEDCLLSSYLNITFVNNPVFVQHFVPTNKDIKKREHVSRVISQKLATILVPFLNISYSSFGDREKTDTNSSFGEDFNAADYLDNLSGIQEGEGNDINEPFDEFSIKGDLQEKIKTELEQYRELALSSIEECIREFSKQHSNEDWSEFGQQVQVIVGADRIFWSKYKGYFPLLSFANRLFNSLPSTSIHAERLFSLAAQISEQRRNQLSDQVFEDLCVIRSFLLRLRLDSINITDCTLTDALSLTKKLNSKEKP